MGIQGKEESLCGCPGLSQHNYQKSSGSLDGKVWSKKEQSSQNQPSGTLKTQIKLRGQFPIVHSILLFAEFLQSIAQ